MSIKIAQVYGNRITERVVVINTETGNVTHKFEASLSDIKDVLEVAGVQFDDLGYLSKSDFQKQLPEHKFKNEW